MRGVLVHEIQAIGTFGDQIGRADLADEAQERDGGLDDLDGATGD